MTKGSPVGIVEDYVLNAEAPTRAARDSETECGWFYSFCMARRCRADSDHCRTTEHRWRVQVCDRIALRLSAADQGDPWASSAGATAFDAGDRDCYDVDPVTCIASPRDPQGSLDDLYENLPTPHDPGDDRLGPDCPWVASRAVVQGAMGLLAKLGSFTSAPAEEALRYTPRGCGVGYETA